MLALKEQAVVIGHLDMSHSLNNRLFILEGEFGGNPLSHLQQDTKPQMATVAIAIPLAHQGFGAIVLAFHKTIREAGWQEVKKDENFDLPEAEDGQPFLHLGRPLSFYTG